MNANMHGRQVNVMDVDPRWTQSGNPERVSSGNGRTLTLSATHHGDHDQFWVVETVDGRETRRWRVAALNYIEWVGET